MNNQATDKIIEDTRIIRERFVELVDGLTIEQLNRIPAGFANNIAWNFGHIVISQQTLCYDRGGFKGVIDPAFIPKYARGSKPEGFISAVEIGELKQLAFSLTDRLATDLENGYFQGFQPFVTLFGMQVRNAAEAAAYSISHDHLHLGYAMAQRKIVR
ncbi:DinB family protein [Pedobacter yulinensis]|uniref:DinB family protein n=1 Tax=Pedobacter yulinensis TaxID=2126353 RepID=A0A2T3HHG6_9SPHI|nr:DinB family protein [Pedobacter yulinensis]PST81872.1 DinB family protein [Pedobacter yulinensis]